MSTMQFLAFAMEKGISVQQHLARQTAVTRWVVNPLKVLEA